MTTEPGADAAPAPLIVTLKLDAAAFALLDGLRKRHFPAERNFLSAHVTLFHALPGEQEESVRETLRAACAEAEPMALLLPSLRFLGRGVAVNVEGVELARLRGRLAHEWFEWLGPQDRQGFRPHVTVQNKTTPEAARRLLAELEETWEPVAARGEGLLLWRYRGGPWEEAGTFPFGG